MLPLPSNDLVERHQRRRLLQTPLNLQPHMNKSALTILTACALLSAASLAQDPGFMQKLDGQKHRELMPVHARMMELQKKHDAELKPLLKTMNTADGEKRVDAMIAVIKRLVEGDAGTDCRTSRPMSGVAQD